MIKVKLSARKFTPYACTLFGVRRREPSHVFTDPPVCSPLPTHNREPYNTLLSDTIFLPQLRTSVQLGYRAPHSALHVPASTCAHGEWHGGRRGGEVATRRRAAVTRRGL